MRATSVVAMVLLLGLWRNDVGMRGNLLALVAEHEQLLVGAMNDTANPNRPLHVRDDAGNIQVQTPSGPPALLVADPEVKSLFSGLCRNDGQQLIRPEGHCVMQRAEADPAEGISDCSPFQGGRNSLFGLKWCAWAAHIDGHISNFVLQSRVPDPELMPMKAFREVIKNKPRGIVIDAGAQVGLFSAAALSAGHYTISIDARPEHIQMNLVSRALNNLVNETNGMVVHGALSDRCGQWATIPRDQQEKGNPGATHIVGRVANGWPLFKTEDEFYQLSKVPVLTLDHVLETAIQTLPVGVERKVYAFKIDIEGYEPRALMGATRLLSHMKPDIVIMELFVHRFKDCDARKLISSIAKLGYSVDVSARLGLSCNLKSCSGLTFDSEKLNNFLNKVNSAAEMDVVFRKISMNLNPLPG